jgi:GDPmannose 4,6-dehydratase
MSTMRKAIITGITGQDAAYLSQILIEKGYQVIGITRSNTKSNLDNLNYLGIESSVKVEECDLTDFVSVLSLLKEYVPEEIYNLSAQSSVGLSFKQPIGTIHYNSVSVLNILEAIRILSLKTKLYQASSSEMYGNVDSLPITLNTPMHPVSPYAISKATAYWTTIAYRESYNIFISNGVLFNHESYLRTPNFFIKKVLQDSIKIKRGILKELKVGNIDIKRDFGYAPLYAEAMWLSLQQEAPNDYIICSGQSVSLREIIYYIFGKLGIPYTAISEDASMMRPNEIKNIYGDNSLAKKQLSWNYNLSFFEVLDLLIKEELRNQIL